VTPELQKFNARALIQLVNDPRFEAAEHKPISAHRARSHAANPRVRSEDTLLYLFKDDEGLLAYLGCMPEQLGVSGIRFGWLTCMWTHPRGRGQGLASRLLREAANDWAGNLLLGDFVPGMERVYAKSGAFGTQPHRIPGVRLYILSELARLLPPKASAFAKTRPLLRILDGIANVPLRFKTSFGVQAPSVTFEEHDGLTQQALAFIKSYPRSDSELRSAAGIQWMIDHPWILPSKQPTANQDGFYFTSYASTARSRVLTILDDLGSVCAVLVFFQRDAHLRLPYLFCRKAEIPQVLEVLRYHLSSWGVATFTTFQPQLVDALLADPRPALRARAISRNLMIATALQPHVKALALQDGDGDLGFT